MTGEGTRSPRDRPIDDVVERQVGGVVRGNEIAHRDDVLIAGFDLYEKFLAIAPKRHWDREPKVRTLA